MCHPSPSPLSPHHLAPRKITPSCAPWPTTSPLLAAMLQCIAVKANKKTQPSTSAATRRRQPSAPAIPSSLRPWSLSYRQHSINVVQLLLLPSLECNQLRCCSRQQLKEFWLIPPSLMMWHIFGEMILVRKNGWLTPLQAKPMVSLPTKGGFVSSQPLHTIHGHFMCSKCSSRRAGFKSVEI